MHKRCNGVDIESQLRTQLRDGVASTSALVVTYQSYATKTVSLRASAERRRRPKWAGSISRMHAVPWRLGVDRRSRLLAVSSLLLTLAACTAAFQDSGTAAQSPQSGRPAATASESAASVSVTSQSSPSALGPEISRADPDAAMRWWDRKLPPPTCPVTKSTGAAPPASLGQLPRLRDSAPVPWSDAWYGNEVLWTALSKTGVVPAIQGSVKWPWWRVIAGPLLVTASPVGNPGPPVTGDVPSGYESTGFQASVLDLPALGCWTITGALTGEPPLSITVWIQAGPN